MCTLPSCSSLLQSITLTVLSTPAGAQLWACLLEEAERTIQSVAAGHQSGNGKGRWRYQTAISPAVGPIDGGTVLQVATLGPGSLFGEIGVLHGKPHTASVVSLSDMTVYTIQVCTNSHSLPFSYP